MLPSRSESEIVTEIILKGISRKMPVLCFNQNDVGTELLSKGLSVVMGQSAYGEYEARPGSALFTSSFEQYIKFHKKPVEWVHIGELTGYMELIAAVQQLLELPIGSKGLDVTLVCKLVSKDIGISKRPWAIGHDDINFKYQAGIRKAIPKKYGLEFQRSRAYGSKRKPSLLIQFKLSPKASRGVLEFDFCICEPEITVKYEPRPIGRIPKHHK